MIKITFVTKRNLISETFVIFPDYCRNQHNNSDIVTRFARLDSKLHQIVTDKNYSTILLIISAINFPSSFYEFGKSNIRGLIKS